MRTFEPALRWNRVGRAAAVVVAHLAIAVDVAQGVGCNPPALSYETTEVNSGINGGLCLGSLRCDPAIAGDPRVTPVGGCDPATSTCALTVEVDWLFPGNRLNDGGLASMTLHAPDGMLIGSCGSPSDWILGDRGVARFNASLSCVEAETAPPGAYTYTLFAFACSMNPFCGNVTEVNVDVAALLAASSDCQPPPPPPPPPPGDCGGDSCSAGCFGPGGGIGGGGNGGSSAGGGPPSLGPQGDGPGATLRYRGGGTGHPDHPKPASWNATLGRYWSHDYAEAIVEDPDATHVWLLTSSATFREFTDAGGDGDYETAVPSDEYRKLTKTVDGWELRDLDGMVKHFDAMGRWVQAVDRNGNATVADYDGDQLVGVAFPDGRSETFAYDVGGRLESITEVGVDGTTTRAWSYTWSGDDLRTINRPDGTAWEMLYDEPAHPGYMTRLTLIGTDLSERIEGAWEYDAEGNVIRTWRGAEDFTDPQAVDKWSFSFDDPALPVVTTVTDPLNNVSTYTFGRDPASTKPRLEQVDSDCPTCGMGPNTQLRYDDPLNPLRKTMETDGRGNVTLYDYDVHGRLTSRVEAFGTALERETTWEYDATFPAFVTEMVQPSTTGNPLDERRTSYGYDASGNQDTRTIEGVESGAAFTYVTTTTYNSAGMPEDVDPPGYGTADVSSFTYDPARGDLLADTRTDPLIGTTVFEYDAFNRRTAVVDPNLLRTETDYDDLDRVTETRQCQVAQPSDTCSTPIGPVLVTAYEYTAFGDLFQTVLSEGNVVEYGYGHAGRLTSIERKPDADPSSHGERTFYTLNGFGHRVLEELQRWDGGAWVTESATSYEYSTRCQLDKMTSGAGSATESVTEHQYDCEGNLERVWDANHPSAGQTAPATTEYEYDELDRLITVTQPWGGAGGGDVVTAYGYDVQDHLTQVIDGEGTVTSYVYSDRDLMTQETSEVSGTTDSFYNEHGELTSQTDERDITVDRLVDELDRVTFVDYPTASLDVTYVYDDPLVPFSQGRLTSIVRDGASVDYGYDVFGRVTRDGDLTYEYDGNGNRLEMGYPGDMRASYTYDYADREATLDVQVGVDPPRSIVTSSGYLPSGPLTSLTLGNGVVETRLFDSRYFPDLIDVAGHKTRTWDYQTDAVGNVTQIDEVVACNGADLVLDERTVSTTEVFESCGTLTVGSDFYVEAPGDVALRAVGTIGFRTLTGVSVGASLRVQPNADLGLPSLSTRTFGYQDYQYYLTSGDGPWGTLEWTYDTIGNRLSEIRDGAAADTYVYETNTAGTGNRSRLDLVNLGMTGTRDYTFGDAGHLEQVVAGANVVNFTSDEEGRLAGLDRLGNTASMRYDGRSFVERVDERGTGNFVEPAYSFNGVVRSLFGSGDGGQTTSRRQVLYFASRPVGILEVSAIGSETYTTYTFIGTDHLGTPFVATDDSGGEIWSGGFDPFGRDWRADTPDGAQENGIFLRLPGQWLDETWADAALGVELAYNVHRWYDLGTGRYARADPLGLLAGVNHFSYTFANPLRWFDPLGLEKVCCTETPFELVELAEKVERRATDYVETGGTEILPGGGPVVWTFCDSQAPGLPGTGTVQFVMERFNTLGSCSRECTRVHEGWHVFRCGKYGMTASDESYALDEAISYLTEALCLYKSAETGSIDVDEEFHEYVPLPVP
jgi:RHS repeat-associated protein